MSDAAMTAVQPEVTFSMQQLVDDAQRAAIAEQLAGVRWEMSIQPNHVAKNKYGFLRHPAFLDDVFFHSNGFTEKPASTQLVANAKLRLEVTVRFNESKSCWTFVMANGEFINDEEQVPPSAADSAPAVAIAVLDPKIASQVQSKLDRIQHFASWDGTSGDAQVSDLVEHCLELDPTAQPRIDQAIARGKVDQKLLKQFYECGRKYGAHYEHKSEFQELLTDLKKVRPGLVEAAHKNAQKGAAAETRRVESKTRLRAGKPLTRVRGPQLQISAATPLPSLGRSDLTAAVATDLHPHDLRALQQQSAWQLLIDETGTHFTNEANQLSLHNNMLGRFVGLLIPKANAGGLPPLKTGWHAVSQDSSAIETVVQAVLDASVGVIGINVQQLPEVRGDRWALGVMRVIELVLRLMPLNDTTKLEVLIEERSSFVAKTQWPAVAAQLLSQLADTHPHRARHLKLGIGTISKADSPFNGYVDAVAYISSGSSDFARACFKASGWQGTCFLEGDASDLSRKLDWLARGQTLDGNDWSQLLAHPEATTNANIVGTLLAQLGSAAQADLPLWQRYLNHVLGHLDSRDLDLPMLGRQVSWLQQWAPDNQPLPPTLRLLWLTTQLAHANHQGQLEQPWREEMRTLADQLVEEDARLVCRAELNLAVTATNCYDFAQAGEVLQRWNPRASTTPPSGTFNRLLQRLLGTPTPAPAAEALALPKATAGLRYWGQVRSSLGQHAAFTGDLTTAVQCFDEALESFAQLSDPAQAKRESRQTRTYRAIALMDDPSQTDATVREAVTAVIGELPAALSALAQSNASADKYAHHLALRWLVQRPDPTLAAAYLAQRSAWNQDEGHPWPLILLYRGMLLHPTEPAAARELALDGWGVAMADDSGPTVQLIGACCRVIAAHWGEAWEPTEAALLLGLLEVELPLAAERIARLRAELTQPGEPLALLQAVLPFNFR